MGVGGGSGGGSAVVHATDGGASFNVGDIGVCCEGVCCEVVERFIVPSSPVNLTVNVR